MRLASTLALSALLAAGCTDAGEYAAVGSGEPILVRGAELVPGPLPRDTGGPAIDTIDSQNNVVTAGQANKRLAGNARPGAMAIGLRFDDLGTGYWRFPVGVPDPATPGDLSWEAVCDFARDLAPGPHTLRFAASNGDGAWGPSSELTLAVRSIVPKGKVVIALSWDTPADLDLHVFAPSGKEASPKTPTTAIPVDGGVDAGAGDGVLDRDSNASCIDGPREEDLVFKDAPPSGVWTVYVDEFDACGAPTTTFQLVLYVDGEERSRRAGRLIDLDASGGVRADGQPGPLGLFVTQWQF